MTSATDHKFMSRALHLARKGLYTTMPNPRVGCVLVRDGVIVGEGFHKRPGDPHAEIHALHEAGSKAEGATVYVTLEPCSHYGRTPSCAIALIHAKVARVVAAMKDSNPMVSGRGITMLQDKGITITHGIYENEARALNPGFIKKMESGKPYLRLKMAMSLDGRTGMASGESQWITGSAARSDVQKLRARSCAIISGIGSIIQDNSSLTVRPKELGLPDTAIMCQRQPLRVVLDAFLKTPVNARVISGPGNILIASSVEADAHKKEKLEQAGAEVLILDSEHGEISLDQLLKHLAQRDCQEVLLEAGAILAGSAVQQKLVDELIIFMAPVLMGSDAKPLLQMPFQHMSEKLNLNIQDIQAIGSDWKITAVLD